MSYAPTLAAREMQGLGIYWSIPASYGDKTPTWLTDSQWWNKDSRGIGTRCPGDKLYGCPCPDGWKLQVSAAPYHYKETIAKPEGGTYTVDRQVPQPSVWVKNKHSGQLEPVPRLFSCIPQAAPCQSGQTRVHASLYPYDVEIHPLPGEPAGPTTIVYKNRKPAMVEGDFCFDRDPRAAPDPKQSFAWGGATYTCAELLKALGACKGITTGGCKAFNDIEGIIRLNCAQQGGYEDSSSDDKSGGTEQTSTLKYVAIGALGLGAVAWLATRKKKRGRR